MRHWSEGRLARVEGAGIGCARVEVGRFLARSPSLRHARVGGRDDDTLQNEGQGQRICAGGREGGHRCCMVPAPAAQRVEGTRWFASVNTRRIERTGASRRAGGRPAAAAMRPSSIVTLASLRPRGARVEGLVAVSDSFPARLRLARVEGKEARPEGPSSAHGCATARGWKERSGRRRVDPAGCASGAWVEGKQAIPAADGHSCALSRGWKGSEADGAFNQERFAARG